MYVGTYGGAYKTTNGGINWIPTGSALQDWVETLAVDPSNTATLYAGTFNSGVFKSVDGGATWFLTRWVSA